jgi:hypothetical protein
MKKAAWFGLSVCALALVIGGWNYAGAFQPVSSRLAQDPRNEKVSMWAYHQYGLVPGTLVIDLRQLSGEAANIDIMRALLQSAEAHKDAKFERVILAYKGSSKFYLEGDYFQTLGKEYATQNPGYTLRTFPENVKKLDGTAAYGSWSGGMLGVLARQMEDLAEFSKAWYLDEALKELPEKT